MSILAGNRQMTALCPLRTFGLKPLRAQLAGTVSDTWADSSHASLGWGVTFLLSLAPVCEGFNVP